MSNIINSEFKIGDIFRGLINREKFIVTNVGKEKTVYLAENSYTYKNNTVYVTFKSMLTGKLHQTNLATAQRLLFEKEI